MICVLLMLQVLLFGGRAAAEEGVAPAAPQETPAPQEDAAPELMQLQLGSSEYAVTVPGSFRNGEVTIEEVQANQIAYYYSPATAMDFDIYQFHRPYPEMSLAEYTKKLAADFNGGNVHTRMINGIEVGTYKSREVYGGIEYDVMSALIEEGEDCIEIVFWLDGENAEQEAAAILSTLSLIENFDLQLGTSPYFLSIPMGYKPGEITEEDKEEDLVGYYYSDSSPLDFDVYQWAKDGDTLEKYAIEEAQSYEAERVDYRTVNDILLAFYYSYEEDQGQMYSVANYLFENGDELMEVSFWLDGDIAVKQADRILSTLHRVDGGA